MNHRVGRAHSGRARLARRPSREGGDDMQAILNLQKLETANDVSAMAASTVSNHCIR